MSEPRQDPLSPERHAERTTFLVNRVLKNKARLDKWARTAGVSCWRLYDVDIPEIPLAIDWYEGRLVVAEYRTFERDDPAAWAAAVADLVDAVRAALGVDPGDCFLKRRERQTGTRQYGKLDGARQEAVVKEGGCSFLVNFSDYLDVGLFLDHRETRARVRAEARGARVLNLFAYTGSFTVHAVAGGARATTTVDLSATYLDWARRNLDLNFRGLDPAAHRFVRADVFEFLAGAVAARERYDLIVLDPPTFSNSKSTETVLDLRRDHAWLVNACLALLEPGGVLWFSTNARRFKLEDEALQGVAELADLSEATIPPDFRDRKIHRTWRIVRDHGRVDPGPPPGFGRSAAKPEPRRPPHRGSAPDRGRPAHEPSPPKPRKRYY